MEYWLVKQSHDDSWSLHTENGRKDNGLVNVKQNYG